MKIDSNTKFKISNKSTGEFGLYSLSYLVIPVGLKKIMEAVMTDPIEAGNIIKDILSSARTSIHFNLGVIISKACLYLAVCCYLGETNLCKSIINTIVDTYDISIDYPKDSTDIKDILKEIVKTIIDKHSDTFEAMARKCNKELSV